MEQVKVFLDSDVVISALLSEKGASFSILKDLALKKIISQTIRNEIAENIHRLTIPQDRRKVLKNVSTITIGLKKARLAKNYFPYVSDLEDSHVVAGAVKAKSSFLLTHNTRHFNSDLIQEKLKITVLTPGQFLQYLRSLPRH